MKKLSLLLATVLLLGACSEEEAQEPVEQVVEEQQVIEVEMNPEVVQNDDGTVQFIGDTNLPDGGELMFSFSKVDAEGMSQSKTIVQDGEFESSPHSKDGGFEPGEYTLNISLSIPTTQSDEFVAVAGEEYENLTGDLMEDAVVGKAMHYEEIVNIE